MDNNRKREAFILHTMTTGFSRAAHSFTTMIGSAVRINNAHTVLISDEEGKSFLQEESGDVYLLTTQIIGDVTGKSFLVVSEKEASEILRLVAENNASVNEKMKEALLLEIDNIISASVIAELSNALKIEVYGDVPQIKKVQAKELASAIIERGETRDDLSMVLMNASFRIGQHEDVHPQFIWKLAPKVFDVVPVEKISA